MSDPSPIFIYAETLDFDDDAGTLKAGMLTAAVRANPPLKADQVVAVLRASPSAESIVVGLIEDADNAEAPFQLVAIHTPAATPPQLASVPRVAQLPTHFARPAGSGGVVDYVLSTKAGTGRAVPFWEAVLHPLLRLAAEALAQDTEPDNIVVTDSDDSVRKYARGGHAPAGAPRTIVLLSGDGGVVDLLNSSAEEGGGDGGVALPTIALIPLGTGNALFNSLHKPLPAGPSELVLALRTLLHGAAAPLPTFAASFPPGSRIVKYTHKDAGPSSSGAETPGDVAAAEAELRLQETDVGALRGSIVASYGFHAGIVYESDTPAYRAHGAARFGMVAQELLKTSHPYAAEVSIRRPSGSSLEKIPRESHAYVLATLVSNLERTFTISPASRPLDGQLRLVHFEPLGPERTMEAMMKAYDGGKHVEARWDDGQRVHYEDVDELAIKIEDDEERWRKVCIDGTIVDIPKGGTVRVQREEHSRFNIVVDSRVL